MADRAIIDKDYQDVVNIWKISRMKNMKSYQDLYIKVSVLLLANEFENFRKEFVNSFEIDSAHYFSTHGYSSDAVLRFTGVNLKLISDIEKYQFIESMIRGGILMIFKGYVKANNELLKSDNPCKAKKLIIGIGANNSYRHSKCNFFQLKYLTELIQKN